MLWLQLIRQQPGVLGSRRWSKYARLYLRHFNELDHEFDARLNRGYRFGASYMQSFYSPSLVAVAEYVLGRSSWCRVLTPASPG